jgi:DNA-binding transcriptional LysR family regulator
VALHASFAPGIVPLVLDALEPHDADVSCTDAHTEEVIQLLDDGAVDLGFVVPSPYPRTLTVEPFLTDPVICVAHPGHRLAGGRPVRVADLAQDAVACTAWGDGAAGFLAMLRASSVPSARLHAVSPAETVARLARRGSHVGLLTRSTVTADLANGVLAELPVVDLPRWDISLALAYRTADAGTAVVRAVRATVLG